MKTGSVIIGMAVAWAAYGVVYTGYAWLRGYNITVKELWSPVGWYSGQWPPPKIPANQVWPSSSKQAS